MLVFSKLVDRLVVWFELSTTLPGLKRRLFTGLAVLGILVFFSNLSFTIALDFDGLISLLDLTALLFLGWMTWRLWRGDEPQELTVLSVFFGLTVYLLWMMLYSTSRLPAQVVQASILHALAPWFLWFMLLNIGYFFTFRAKAALRLSLIFTTLVMSTVLLIILRNAPLPLAALRDFSALLLANGLVIAVAFPVTRFQERDAQVDFLTTLANRTRGYDTLLKEIERAERYGTIFTIILLDLDHFKIINDTYGHPTGDVVLREFAAFISKHIRNTDQLCRWGGEEFLILLPHNDLRSGHLKAEHLRTLIKNRAFHKNLRITSSFGVTTFYPRDSPSTILERADAALYRAKANGRNCVEAE